MRALLLALLALSTLKAQLAIQGEKVYTMAGAAIENGVVLIRNGKIERVGPAAQVQIPTGYRTLSAKVVTPGLIDAHTVIGLSGYLNQPQDQDQLEKTTAMQPELRAVDAYDPREKLIEWVRGFGVTTIHTGHGPGALISGQTMIIKTNAPTADAAMVPAAMVAVSLGDLGKAETGKSPGTRPKEIALLRSEFIKAKEYTPKTRDLHLETLARVLKGELRLLITVHRANDIVTALRLAKEFNLKIVLDGAAESQLVLEQIKAAGFPVIIHPTMMRANAETENATFEDAAKLQSAGIPWALQSGFEEYVPKTRVVLWEAGVAAANGLTFDQALAGITINAAKLLGIANRVGSLETGKDADLALYDGDPFEYTSHCTGVVIDGAVISVNSR
jgi:imidazolonepropionase-like amidohydrolase